MLINKVNSTAYYPNVAATRYTSNARGVQKSAAFTLSTEAQSFGEMLKKLKATPEVRADKVSEIQQKISAGEYSVSAENLALSLLTNRY